MGKPMDLQGPPLPVSSCITNVLFGPGFSLVMGSVSPFPELKCLTCSILQIGPPCSSSTSPNPHGNKIPSLWKVMLRKQTLQRGYLSQMFGFFVTIWVQGGRGPPALGVSRASLQQASICLARCCPREGQRRKDKTEFLLKISLPREKKQAEKVCQVEREARQCHLILINADSQQCEMHTARKYPCSLECGPVAAVWERIFVHPHAKMLSSNPVLAYIEGWDRIMTCVF